jgi:hypothetical protein
MMHRHVFESVDHIVRHLLKTSTIPFEGKTVVFGGDFRQVSPVVVRGSQAQIKSSCLKMSTLWPSIQVLELKHNMRVQSMGSSNDFYYIIFLYYVKNEMS